MTNEPSFTSKVLTTEIWPDLVSLFGKNGASGGCWCMFFRQPRKAFYLNKGDANRELFHQVVVGGQPVGLLAYDGDQPVGWIATSPRENYTTFATSRNYKPVDEKPVWVITCFYIARKYRRNGVSRFLISEALVYAKRNGALGVEAYPTDTHQLRMQDASAYKGIYQVFLDSGFEEVARRFANAPIVRYDFSQHE